MGYVKKTQNRLGMPSKHVGFWKDLPYLVTEGVAFSCGVAYAGAKATYRGGRKACGKTPSPQKSRTISTKKPMFRDSWKRPSTKKARQKVPVAVNKDWTQHIDPNSRQPYWFNAKTGQSTWYDPHARPRI